jgi:hypothetical protein
MKLPLFTLLVMVARNLANCSYLGLQDPTSLNCVCEPGWIGDTCSQLNFIPKVESPAAYNEGLYDPQYPTWGGSILEINHTFYGFASTMGNAAGLSCWPQTSACGIWKSDSINGSWKFISFIGDPALGNNTVPWCHNVRFTIEYKLDNGYLLNSNKTFALVGYALRKTNSATGKYYAANLGPANNKICKGYSGNFPSNQKQSMHVLYKVLKAKNDKDIVKEIAQILETNTMAHNVNGFDRNERVNSQLQWTNLKPKIQNTYDSSVNPPVNPQPLISNSDNYAVLTTNNNGFYYRPLAYRFSKPESIGILAVRADNFIWETGASYVKAQEIKIGRNIEDPFFFASRDGFHLIVHDNNDFACKNIHTTHMSCGTIMHFPRNDNHINLLSSTDAKYWTVPQILYGSHINGLQDGVYSRQRPYLFFSNKTARALFNSTVWPGKFQNNAWVSKHGAIKLYPVFVQ